MDADWYEDPLDRFDGRFFDGERWTAEVSDNGALRIDPDFEPDIDANVGQTAAETVREVDADDPAAVEPVVVHVENTAPAVAPVGRGNAVRATATSESPVRVVAVLDESVIRSTLEPHQPPPNQGSVGRSVSRWIFPIAIAAGLLLIGLLAATQLGGDDTAADQPGLAPEQVDRVEDLETSSDLGPAELDAMDLEELEVDAPAGVVDEETAFPASDLVDIEGFRIVNGASVLAELADWHQGYALDQGIDLAPESGCWFGQLGGAVVQEAHCGPITGESTADYRFDRVPLGFVDVERGKIAQPVIAAVLPDSVVSNALILVGAPDGPQPPEGMQQTRGEGSGG